MVSFRHTATLACMQLMRSLIAAYIKLQKHLAVNEGHLQTELGNARPSKSKTSQVCMQFHIFFCFFVVFFFTVCMFVCLTVRQVIFLCFAMSTSYMKQLRLFVGHLQAELGPLARCACCF